MDGRRQMSVETRFGGVLSPGESKRRKDCLDVQPTSPRSRQQSGLSCVNSVPPSKRLPRPPLWKSRQSQQSLLGHALRTWRRLPLGPALVAYWESQQELADPVCLIPGCGPLCWACSREGTGQGEGLQALSSAAHLLESTPGLPPLSSPVSK